MIVVEKSPEKLMYLGNEAHILKSLQAFGDNSTAIARL